MLSIVSEFGDIYLSNLDNWKNYTCTLVYLDEFGNVLNEDVTDIALWSSTDEDVAAIGEYISGGQRVYGLSAGKSTITCSYEELNYSVLLTVQE